jgi:hypothetical protein
MPATGEVYYGRYTFKDGGFSQKFVIIVCCDKKNSRIISCIATKVPNEKNRNPGCHPRTQRFLILANNEGFDRDTYLELLRLKEWECTDFSKNIISSDLTFERTLTPATVKAIKECYKKMQYDTPSALYPMLIS